MASSFHLYAAAPWRAHEPYDALGADVRLDAGSSDGRVLEAALARIEYRGAALLDRATQLLQAGPTSVLARSPVDLAALLRSSEQLLLERARDLRTQKPAWRCECGQRYTVCAALLQPVSLQCDGCAARLTLDAAIPGRLALGDDFAVRVNEARETIARFFQEAMARGWPVLVRARAE